MRGPCRSYNRLESIVGCSAHSKGQKKGARFGVISCDDDDMGYRLLCYYCFTQITRLKDTAKSEPLPPPPRSAADATGRQGLPRVTFTPIHRRPAFCNSWEQASKFTHTHDVMCVCMWGTGPLHYMKAHLLFSVYISHSSIKNVLPP